MKRLVFVSIFAVSLAALGASVGHGAEPPTTLRALYGLEPPAKLEARKTALVLVDFQREYVTGRLPLPTGHAAIERARVLADWAHREGVFVVLVQQVASRPGSPVFAAGGENTDFVPELAPKAGDFVLVKALGGAFSRTSLDKELHARGIETLVVAGLMTHLAVQTTAADAMVLGYRVIVAGDATATRALPAARGEAGVDAALLKRATLDAMADRVADVMLVRDVIALPVAR
jgi:nicotinamidase-related amidase